MPDKKNMFNFSLDKISYKKILKNLNDVFFKNNFKGTNIESFNAAIKLLKSFIAFSSFEKARKGINELKLKEENGFKEIISGLSSSSSIKICNNELSRRLKKISDIELIIINKEKKISYEKDVVEVNSIKNNIKHLMKNNEFDEVLSQIDFFDKKFILKNSKFKYLEGYFNKIKKQIEKYKELAYTKDIKSFETLVKKLNTLIILKEFDKAEKGIKQIEKIEKDSFEKIKQDMSVSRRKVKKAEKIYNKRSSIFNVMLKKINLEVIKKSNYNREINRKKILLETKNDIKLFEESLSFDKGVSFLEEKILENKQDLLIVGEFNKAKGLLEKKYKVYRKNLHKNNDAKKEAEILIGEKVIESIDIEDERMTFIKEIKLWIKLKKDFIVKKISNHSYEKTVTELNFLTGGKIKGNNKIIKKTIKDFHEGLNKLLEGVSISGYDFYGKTLGAEKITGDTFSYKEKSDRYWFAFGDATGHGLLAGYSVSLFTKRFFELLEHYDDLRYFAMNINNELKLGLKAGNFITGIFFEIEKKDINIINTVGMGHEPIYLYRSKENKVYEHRLLGLGGGMRKINKIDSVIKLSFNMGEGDIILSFTDGISEAKNKAGDMYSMPRIKDKFLEAINLNNSVKSIYDYIIQDLGNFTEKSNYDDDVTLTILKRSTKKDILVDNDLDKIVKDNGLNFTVKNKLKGKNREEIMEKVLEEKKQKELRSILLQLDVLYKTGELIKLKSESVRFIKEGYIHKKINFYLKKSIDGEYNYKIRLKNEKLMSKYKLLEGLHDRGDYKTVIKEASDVILKNGNI